MPGTAAGLDRWTSGATAPWSMGYLTRAELPFTYALADAFTVCDGYHASVLGPTDPNRLVLFTGTIDPGGRGGGPVIDNSHEGGLRWTTFPERLQAAGVSWRVYHEADDFSDNALRFFDQYQHAPRILAALPERDLEPRGRGIRRRTPPAGRLPQVSWIVAPTPTRPSIPGYGSMAAGEDYVSRQLRAVMDNPAAWARTVFLVCYDEHGGFFDHVPPPIPPPGTPGEFVDGAPIGLGIRVPMIICSPFTRGRERLPRDVRSHLDHPLPRAPVRGARDEHQRLAPADLRRPDRGTRLRPPRPLDPIPCRATGAAARRRPAGLPEATVPPLPPLLGASPHQEPGVRRMVSFPEPHRPPPTRHRSRHRHRHRHRASTRP